MKILVINAGSSSLKYQLLDMTDENVVAKGNCERIGLDGGIFSYKTADGRVREQKVDMPDHTAAFTKVKDAMLDAEVVLDVDSAGHWQRTMQGHSAANVVPVAAANRYGTEVVTPCRENGGQQSALRFYGSSFLTDETGAILAQAGRDEDAVLTASYDFAAIRQARLEWGLFRDRRPECYGALCDLD